MKSGVVTASRIAQSSQHFIQVKARPSRMRLPLRLSNRGIVSLKSSEVSEETFRSNFGIMGG